MCIEIEIETEWCFVYVLSTWLLQPRTVLITGSKLKLSQFTVHPGPGAYIMDSST
jgi:hypothetical protein